jgi:O-antigen/teichoic acid export membrane protein
LLRVKAIREHIREGPRLRRGLHGALSAVAGKGTSLLVSLVTLPITIRYLGRVEYGIWVTVSSTVLLLGVLDLGIASTLTNHIAKANAKDDRDAARDYYATAFFITMAIALFLAGIFYAAWLRISWGQMFGVHDPVLAYESGLCVGIAVLFFLLNLPLTLASRVLGGYQEVQISNYFAMFGSLLNFAAIILGIKAHLSIVGLMTAFCGAMLTINLFLNLWLMFGSRPWIRPRLSSVRRTLIRELFGEGIRFFILQLSGLVVFNSDNLVITHYLGAGEVTPYSVTSRLMSCAVTLHTLLIPVLWPMFSDAFHRGDMQWLRNTYNRVASMTLIVVSPLVFSFALFGREIIRLWATPAAVPSYALLWSMAFWVIILAISTNQSCLLAASQRIGLQAVTSSVAAAFNLVSSIYLVQRLGSFGVVIATILSYLIFVIAPQGWEVRKILGGRYNKVTEPA